MPSQWNRKTTEWPWKDRSATWGISHQQIIKPPDCHLRFQLEGNTMKLIGSCAADQSNSFFPQSVLWIRRKIRTRSSQWCKFEGRAMNLHNNREEAKCLWTPYTHLFFRCLISYCWYNPQPMRNNHSIAGTTFLQTTLEDADNTQFYWW